MKKHYIHMDDQDVLVKMPMEGWSIGAEFVNVLDLRAVLAGENPLERLREICQEPESFVGTDISLSEMDKLRAEYFKKRKELKGMR